MREAGNDEILFSNWDGETEVIFLIEEILADEATLLGEKRKLVLKYTGVCDRE